MNIRKLLRVEGEDYYHYLLCLLKLRLMCVGQVRHTHHSTQEVKCRVQAWRANRKQDFLAHV